MKRGKDKERGIGRIRKGRKGIWQRRRAIRKGRHRERARRRERKRKEKMRRARRKEKGYLLRKILGKGRKGEKVNKKGGIMIEDGGGQKRLD